MRQLLIEPMTSEAVAKHLNICKGQAQSWLKRLVADGNVKKTDTTGLLCRQTIGPAPVPDALLRALCFVIKWPTFDGAA
jgi:hypothetical protein